MRTLLCAFCITLLLFACGEQDPEPKIDINGAATPAWGPSNGDATRGYDLALKHCQSCHKIDGEGIAFPGAPPFETTAARADLKADYLRGWLKDPLRMKRGTLMPNLSLAPQEIEDLIAWLYTLRPEAETAEKGATPQQSDEP